MGKKKFYTSVIVGAVVGGLVALFDDDAKRYVKTSLQKTGNSFRSYVKDPIDAIEQMKECAEAVKRTVDENVSGTLSTLETIESSLSKFMKK